MVACDLTQPSPLALEVLSARPYAYLDDAPLEERRTQAVMARRWLAPETAADLGRLDADAIARVRSEVRPDPRDADELHDALMWLGTLSDRDVESNAGWAEWLADLARQKRVARVEAPQRNGMDRRRALAGIPGAVARGANSSAGRGAPREGCARLVAGGSADRNPAGPARG